MVILKDGLEKIQLINEAVQMYMDLKKRYPELTAEEIGIIYPELMTNVRGVSMRKGR